MKILWFSRHIMTEDQIRDLQSIYGPDLDIHQVSKTAASWKEVADEARDCDIIAAVLPLHILADLTDPKNNAKPVIQAASRRIPVTQLDEAGNPVTVFQFEHDRWYQVTSAAVQWLS